MGKLKQMRYTAKQEEKEKYMKNKYMLWSF